MFRLAILGTENSHAEAFAKLIKTDPDFDGFEIVGAYGYSGEANKNLADKGLVTRFARTPDEFLGEVDGILVTARHGDHHYEYAIPYIKQGVSAFIDKPATVREDYADALFGAAEASGALVCGGSSLKFLAELDELTEFVKDKKIVGGTVSAPVSMVNDYAGFYFYSQHLIEMLFRVFGSGVKRVYAYCPDKTLNRVSVIFDYGAFDVTAQYYGCYEYTCSVHTDKGTKLINTFDLGDIYKRELTEFKEMVESRVLPHAIDELKKPVRLMHAIEESYMTGKMVETGL